MNEMRLGVVESRFADIVWNNEPLTTRKLVELCEEELNWKRTTTYTVLKKLCNRGIFVTENSVVTSLLSKGEFLAILADQFVKQNFGGSVPDFVAAYATRNKLTPEELAQLKELISVFEME